MFAATFAAAAVVILGRAGPPGAALDSERASAPRVMSMLAGSSRLAVAALAYAIVHVGFGCRLGWYPSLDHLPVEGASRLLCVDLGAGGLGPGPGIWVDLLRGALWALVGLLVVSLLRGGAVEASVALGLFLALAAPVHQLLPNPVVPSDWAVGWGLVRTASQFVMGSVLGLWFSWCRSSSIAAGR